MAGEDGTDVVCKHCAPDMHFLKCDICKDQKPMLNFPQRERREGGSVKVRRCWACFTCQGCGAKQSDKGAFVQDAFCKQCREHVCDVCSKTKTVANFPSSQMHHRTEQNTHLRCTACHTCVECKKRQEPENFQLKATMCM